MRRAARTGEGTPLIHNTQHIHTLSHPNACMVYFFLRALYMERAGVVTSRLWFLFFHLSARWRLAPPRYVQNCVLVMATYHSAYFPLGSPSPHTGDDCIMPQDCLAPPQPRPNWEIGYFLKRRGTAIYGATERAKSRAAATSKSQTISASTNVSRRLRFRRSISLTISFNTRSWIDGPPPPPPANTDGLGGIGGGGGGGAGDDTASPSAKYGCPK